LVDHELRRVLLDRIVAVLARLDVDALRRADRRAHVARDAAGLAVLARYEAVQAAVAHRIGDPLLRVLHRRDGVPEGALAGDDVRVRIAIAEEVDDGPLRRDAEAADDRGDVEALVPGEAAVLRLVEFADLVLGIVGHVFGPSPAGAPGAGVDAISARGRSW